MSIQHEIKILKMSVMNLDNLSDVIVEMEWRLTSTKIETGKVEMYASVCRLEAPKDHTSFIDFSNISEELAMEWLTEAVKKQVIEKMSRSRESGTPIELPDPFSTFKLQNEKKLNFVPPPVKREKKLPWQ